MRSRPEAEQIDNIASVDAPIFCSGINNDDVPGSNGFGKQFDPDWNPTVLYDQRCDSFAENVPQIELEIPGKPDVGDEVYESFADND